MHERGVNPIAHFWVHELPALDVGAVPHIVVLLLHALQRDQTRDHCLQRF
jgi:hypothetical protein